MDDIKSKTSAKIWPVLDQSTTYMSYQSLIVPIYYYGGVIYNCLSQKDSAMIQRLQNMELEVVLNVGKLTSIPYICQILNVPPLELLPGIGIKC